MNAISTTHDHANSIRDKHGRRRMRIAMVLVALAMSSTTVAAAAASRAIHSARGRSATGAFVPLRSPTSFATWSRKHGELGSPSLATSTSVAVSPLTFSPPCRSISSIPPSALCMASRNFAKRRLGTCTDRSISSSASAALFSSKSPTIDADTSTPNNNDQKNKKKKQPKHKKKNKRKNEADTGRLRLLPPLQPSSEILARATRQTHNEIKDDVKIANQRRRAQKRGAQTIDLLCQKLCAPLKATVQTYRRELKYMHPFEKVVMELTVRARQKKDGLTLTTALEEVHEGRKELLQLSKDWIAKIKSSPTAREAHECAEEAREALCGAFSDMIDAPWGGVAELQRSLRNVPIVRLDCPAVVLVGAPNVGKSSIVRAISSGTPEVNNYPFTTRGMTLGHVQVYWESDGDVAEGNVAGVSIPSERHLAQERLVKRGVKSRRMEEEEAREVFSREKERVATPEETGADMEAAMRDVASDAAEVVGATGNDAVGRGDEDERDPRTQTPSVSKKVFAISQLCQIMDSPGILRRDDPDAVRNEMEELTLAAMSHLPTAVMYVMDLSGGAGDACSSVEDQLVLRRELRARFPRRPWVDVVSKSDLGAVEGGRERLAQILEAEGGAADLIELSVKEGWGVAELRQEVMRMLGEVRVVLDAMAAVDGRSARAV